MPLFDQRNMTDELIRGQGQAVETFGFVAQADLAFTHPVKLEKMRVTPFVALWHPLAAALPNDFDDRKTLTQGIQQILLQLAGAWLAQQGSDLIGQHLVPGVITGRFHSDRQATDRANLRFGQLRPIVQVALFNLFGQGQVGIVISLRSVAQAARPAGLASNHWQPNLSRWCAARSRLARPALFADP